MPLNTIAILLIAAGIASVNLLFAGLYGRIFQITRNVNCILMMVFLFIIQNEMVILGDQCAHSNSFSAYDKWILLIILVFTEIIMIYHCFEEKWNDEYLSFTTWELIYQVLFPSLVVFGGTYAFNNLIAGEHKFSLYMMPLLIIFIVIGSFLGILHRTQLLKWLHLMGTGCFASGMLLLLFYK